MIWRFSLKTTKGAFPRFVLIAGGVYTTSILPPISKDPTTSASISTGQKSEVGFLSYKTFIMEKLFVYIFDLYEKSNVNCMFTFEQPLNKLLIFVRNRVFSLNCPVN